MKEFAQNIFREAVVRFVSRYGVLGEREVVTLAKLPRRGVIATHMERTDLRVSPTPETTAGFFTITSRSKGKYTLENQVNRIRISGVPRRGIQKIIQSDLFD
jgi:hypothetical protein